MQFFICFSFKLEAKHTQQNLAVNKFEYKSTGSDCTENREAVKGAGKWETERVALFSSFEEMGEPACLVRSFSHPSSECSNEPNEVTSGLLFAYFTFLAFLFSFQFVRSSYIVKIFHGSLSVLLFFCYFCWFVCLDSCWEDKNFKMVGSFHFRIQISPIFFSGSWVSFDSLSYVGICEYVVHLCYSYNRDSWLHLNLYCSASYTYFGYVSE